jgi:hypothetical protein
MVSKNLEVEVKYVVPASILDKIVNAGYTKKGLVQWYLNESGSTRVRATISGSKEVSWEKTTKIEKRSTETGTLYREEINSVPEAEDLRNLYNHKMVAKVRYYLDESHEISVDCYVYPQKDPVMEIELDPKEIERYNQDHRQLQNILIEKLQRVLPKRIHAADIIIEENNRTKDPSYKNKNVAMLGSEVYFDKVVEIL